jgi:hypothetical protein
MSNFPSVATQSSAGKIGRVGAGGAITKSKCKPKATEDLQPKKAKRDYINELFIALEKKAPESSDKIQCFIRIFYYFISLYGCGIFRRRPSPSWNSTSKKKTTGWNIIDTELAFKSGAQGKMLAIQEKCHSYFQSYCKKDDFFTPTVISESLAFVDDSIQIIIHEVTPPVRSINPEIEQLMAAHKIPKKSALLNYDALNALFPQQK